MEGSNEVSNSRNFSCTSNQMLYPPIRPLSCPIPSYMDSLVAEQVGNQIAEEEQQHGQQWGSSESMAIEEEQPSWLDDLLNEPPEVQHVPKGHRRSASDSSAYLDAAFETFKMREGYKFRNPSVHSPWSSQNFVHPNLASFNTNASPFSEHYIKENEKPLNYSNSLVGDGMALQDSGSAIEKHEQVESGLHKPDGSGEKGPEAKTSESKAEAKRAKQ